MFWVPGTNLSLPRSFLIYLYGLHSTCWPATSQLPPAFKVALDECTCWGGGLPGLLVNSSLNSLLGMQSWSVLRVRGSPGLGSGAQLG